MASLSMKGKLTASLCAISAVLIVSSAISIMEFRRVSRSVSELMSDDISSVNAARELTQAANAYNLEILAVIGDDSRSELPDFDRGLFIARCDSLKSALSNRNLQPLSDSVLYSFSAYMLTSLELPRALESGYAGARNWYFRRLQPQYNYLTKDLNNMSAAIYEGLDDNSSKFNRGFYRSIIPTVVAVGVGQLLLLMLLFFILVYYVTPLYKMLASLKSYQEVGKKYTYTFDGDDQMAELNSRITQLTTENQQLRRRIADLRVKSNLSGTKE